MKKTFTTFRALLAGGLLFGFCNAEKAQASHAMGGDITYLNIAPNMYMVSFKLYRDCGGIGSTPSQTLTYRSISCPASPSNLTVNLNNTFVGQPYCNGVVAPCNGTGNLPNFAEDTYSGILTLPANCSDWLVSSRILNRVPSRNLANGGSEGLYIETMINNLATQQNNSPQFGKMPVPFIGVNLNITYSHNVVEPDGDSLVYSLKPALSDYNVPVTYTTYPAYTSAVAPMQNYPGGTFSATNPIISQQPLQLDAFTGNINVKPLSYIAPSSLYDSNNKYVVVVQVDEFRNINGTAVKIGHVRRDMIMSVIDCGTNYMPRLGNLTFNNAPLQPNTVQTISAGIPVIIQVTAEDDNAANVVTLTSNAADALPGSTFTVSGGARPTGTITWTPTAAQLRSAPYFVTVTTTDDACPVKGSQTFTMGLRVRGVASPTGIDDNLPAGSFIAYPNPSNGNQISFKLTNIKADKNAEVLIYNVTGKVVDKLAVKAGEEQIQWSKKANLPTGIYFARLTTVSGSQTIKLIHLK